MQSLHTDLLLSLLYSGWVRLASCRYSCADAACAPSCGSGSQPWSKQMAAQLECGAGRALSPAWGGRTALGSEFSFLAHPMEVLYHIINVFERLAELC